MALHENMVPKKAEVFRREGTNWNYESHQSFDQLSWQRWTFNVELVNCDSIENSFDSGWEHLQMNKGHKTIYPEGLLRELFSLNLRRFRLIGEKHFV